MPGAKSSYEQLYPRKKASGAAKSTVSPVDLGGAGAGLAKLGAQGIKQGAKYLTKSGTTAKPTLAKFAQKVHGAAKDISTFKGLGPTSKK